MDGGISDIASVSHLVQENRRWREKANEGIVGCSEEEEDEIKVIFRHQEDLFSRV